VFRNAVQQSSNKPHPASDDYLEPTPISQAPQSQYDEIQLGQTQQCPGYAELDPKTQGRKPKYDVISPHQKAKNVADYVNVKGP